MHAGATRFPLTIPTVKTNDSGMSGEVALEASYLLSKAALVRRKHSLPYGRGGIGVCPRRKPKDQCGLSFDRSNYFPITSGEQAMFGFSQKKRIKELSQRYGAVIHLLTNGSPEVQAHAMQGLAEGLAKVAAAKEQAGSTWDDGLRLIAASSLEKAANDLHHRGDSSYAKGLMLAAMHHEMQTINRPDAIELKRALNNMVRQLSEGQQPAKSRGNSSPPPAFDGWYLAYKRGAAEINPALLNEDGSSILDFMEKAPLLRAFNDGVDPIMLGREFAQGFDVEKFGR